MSTSDATGIPVLLQDPAGPHGGISALGSFGRPFCSGLVMVFARSFIPSVVYLLVKCQQYNRL